MDITFIARNVVNSLKISAEDKNIGIKLVIDKALKNKIYGDPIRISQVMTNLVHNAMKFTQKDTVEVLIEVKRQTETAITLDFQVKDTGIGISKEKQGLIYERFTQADYQPHGVLGVQVWGWLSAKGSSSCKNHLCT